MATKIKSKNVNYGIIRQNPSSAAAEAFLAAGGTANQWTNPGVANTNYRTWYVDPGSITPDPNVQVDDLNQTSQLGLNKELTGKFINSVSGLKRVPFTGIADKNTLAPLLAGAMQGVADDSLTPFEKVFTSGFSAGTIDFAGGAGYLHTIAGKQGASADDGWILENAIIDTLTLTWDFLQPGKGKLVSVTGTWVGNEMNFDQTLSGTWVATTVTPFNNADTWSFATFTVDSVDFKANCIKRVSLTINNNVSSNCATSAGKPNQYDVMPSYTWNIQLDHNLTTEKLMGDLQAGANVEIDFLNSVSNGTDGYFRIQCSYAQIMDNPFTYDNDYLAYNLNIEALQNSTSSPITITLVDTLQWAYNE